MDPEIQQPQPHQLERHADIGAGRKLRLGIVGQGTPTIVLPPVLGGTIEAWAGFQASISTLGRSVSYDSPGTPGCSPGALPRTSGTSVDDLHKAFKSEKLGPPYIFVGYSAGAFDALLFASRYPGEMEGLILIDPAIAHMDRRLHPLSPVIRQADMDEAQGIAADLQKARDAGLAPVEIARLLNRQSHFSSFFSISSNQIEEECLSLGSIPLAVRTATQLSVEADNLPAVRAMWWEQHKRYALLSTRGDHREIEGGHNIIVEQPTAVFEILREMIEETAR
ncbi:MAG: alpha/beta hydrolase [Alphaproteobacteria bacterium]|nr:MAG: alpha/beta hydrolase [Alphaproteobacteria bacterium]